MPAAAAAAAAAFGSLRGVGCIAGLDFYAFIEHDDRHDYRLTKLPLRVGALSRSHAQRAREREGELANCVAVNAAVCSAT